jgi:CBS domain-containing protein
MTKEDVMKSWTVDDVMTKTVVSVGRTASYRTVVDTLIEHRFSALPVVDDFRRVVGVVSEADLLRKIEYAGDEEPRLFEGPRRRGQRGKARGRTVADLMTSPAVTVLTGTPIGLAARRMDGEQVKRLPVVDDLGRLIGVVTRTDLLKVHLRPDDAIRADVQDAFQVALAGVAGDLTVEVAQGVVTLDGRVPLWSTATEAARLARMVPGAAEVIEKISYDVDDRGDFGPGIAFGVA